MGKRKIIAVVVLDMRDQMGYFSTRQKRVSGADGGEDSGNDWEGVGQE